MNNVYVHRGDVITDPHYIKALLEADNGRSNYFGHFERAWGEGVECGQRVPSLAHVPPRPIPAGPACINCGAPASQRIRGMCSYCKT